MAKQQFNDIDKSGAFLGLPGIIAKIIQNDRNKSDYPGYSKIRRSEIAPPVQNSRRALYMALVYFDQFGVLSV